MRCSAHSAIETIGYSDYKSFFWFLMESHACSAPRAFTKVVKTPQEFGTAIPKGLAKALGVTERTIARWHHFREGPPRVEFGRKVFYRLESVKAWLEVASIRRREPIA